MTKKILSLLLAALMIVTVMAGCTAPREVWVSYSDGEGTGVADNNADNEKDGEDTDKTENGQTTSKVKRTKATTGKTTTAKSGKQTRPQKSDTDMLDFTPVADAGANYDIKGTVSIAVDTVRATDYEAMFDVMQKLYPNIKFEFDYWSHSSNDDGREYLSTRMATGSAANIMWDEAGEIPFYLNQGWIKPITSYVNKDPEAKNIPANLKADYTYYGELFAVPHQATFNVVLFNTDLLNKLGLKLPSLAWSFEDYEKYLRVAGDSFDEGVCVGVQQLDNIHNHVAFYLANKNGGNYGTLGINYKTGQVEVDFLKKGTRQMRIFREIPGAEGWFQEQQKTATGTLLQQQLGIDSWTKAWSTGKALMLDCGTWWVEANENENFNRKMWTIPNTDGKMMLHVDHCFITTGTPADRMDACYQALRFMTFSTNGNLARLTMYEDSQAGKYTLNSHVYYPTTSSKAVVEKFNNLTVTDEVDEYLVKNIPNSSRFDTFKLVPGLRDHQALLQSGINTVTDGGDVSALDEPAIKVNEKLKQAEADLKKNFEKYYK